MLDFTHITETNASRRDRWHSEADDWTGADWSNAMCGEAGEAANVVKKLRRRETSIGSTYNTPETDELLPALAEELADVILYADLLASHYGLNLEEAIITKFNRVSEAQGFPERLNA
jgi:NTP pyrophosphatase (non-canonical NTP hydrolase)